MTSPQASELPPTLAAALQDLAEAETALEPTVEDLGQALASGGALPVEDGFTWLCCIDKVSQAVQRARRALEAFPNKPESGGV